MTTLILASASPARLALLRQAGIEPRVRVSGLDEEDLLRSAAERFGPLDPVDAVLLLAEAKAQAVATAVEAEGTDSTDSTDGTDGTDGTDDTDDELVVLACDSLLELDGAPYGKPVDAEDARARWRAMRGRSGVLHTGHWLVDLRDGSGATLGATSSTTVHFADLSDAEIDAYVATGEPLAVAGAFTVDGLGGPFVTRIEGDHHNVVGLSLPLLRELLAAVDLTVVELWNRQVG